MLKRTKIHLFVTTLLVVPFLLIAGTPKQAYASVNDFVINSFNASYALSNKDKQGTLEVVEQIDLTFSDYNHGILRALPKSYKGHDLQISNIKVLAGPRHQNLTPSAYTTYQSGGNEVLKIGDATKTVTGQQSYEIFYTVNNVIGFYNDHDELYWDVNGDQWQQQFEHVTATVHVPAELLVLGATSTPNEGCSLGADGGCRNDQQFAPQCYAGAFGATAKDCNITFTNDLHELKASTKNSLAAQQTLTVLLAFNKGYFTPVTTAEKLKELAPTITAVFAPSLLLGGYAFMRWRKYGRDAKGRGMIVPEYSAPGDLRPAELGTLTDFKTDNKDISATVIDLAVRKYIKIVETVTQHRLRKDSLDYSLELKTTDFTKLQPFEQAIINGLFGGDNKRVGSVVQLKDLKGKFYTTVASAKKLITSNLVNNGYFVSNPATAAGRLGVLSGICFAFVFFVRFRSPALTGGMLLAGVICAAFASQMSARTQKGVQAKEQALGLKLYLHTAEADRIKMQQSPNAPLASNAGQPVKTVELFEKLLPYAVVFGVEKQWANEFANIYNQPPEWYQGNMSTFNTYYLINSISGGLQTSMNTAFAAPSNSGSSGFSSGGGFSGGGGGGGGGGGW